MLDRIVSEIKKRPLSTLSFFYFISHVFALTRLPVFNDEAIYLDWGLRETQAGGNLYYSLYDNKQPLLMWIFGIFERLLPDPLFAGRFVSLLAGLLVLSGIYLLAKKMFDQKTALLAAVLYAIVPIFVFYDRQALMETAIGAAGVWSVYFLAQLLGTKKKKFAYFLGIVLGLGFFIKSSAVVFILSFVIIFLIELIRNKTTNNYVNFLIVTGSLVLTDLFLLLNPQFWGTLQKNSLYSLTLAEIVRFPASVWLANLSGNLQIMLIFLTPVIFLSGAAGILLAFKSGKEDVKILALWFILGIVIQTFILRGTSQRYLVSFLPIYLIFTSYVFFKISFGKIFKIILLLFISLIPGIASFIVITNPPAYILSLSKITAYAQSGYIKGQTSGYGIPETFGYLRNVSSKQKILVGVAVNAGNPESAVFAYFKDKDNIIPGYMDESLLTPEQKKADCLKTVYPLYFIARDEQQASLNRYFEKIKTFRNPYGPNSIGIYILKKNCRGTTTLLGPEKQP